MSGEHLLPRFTKIEENVVWEGKMNKIIINQISDYGCVSGKHLQTGFMKIEENVVCEGKMNKTIINPKSEYGCVSGEHLLAGFMKTEENVVWEEKMNKIKSLTMGVCQVNTYHLDLWKQKRMLQRKKI